MFSKLFSIGSTSGDGAHRRHGAEMGGGEGASAGEDRENSVPLPESELALDQLHPRLIGHHGVPATASILAFEPTQRVLAVASLDGRIKICGAPGIEALLQSPFRTSCKYLEFINHGAQLVNVTTQNDIEVWDVARLEEACSLNLENDITAIAVLQGTTYMLVIAYGNGLLVSWSLHETRILAIRGGTDSQRKRLTDHLQNSRTFSEKVADRAASVREQFGSKYSSKTEVVDDEEEQKELCTLCWACQNGSVVAAGYMDGDIWLWTIPTSTKGDSGDPLDGDLPFISGSPLRKIDLVPGKSTKMPIIFLKWCGSGKRSKDASGQLFVCGGSELNTSQTLTVFSLDEGVSENLQKLELQLHGPFADAVTLSRPGGTLSTPTAAILVLSSPGLLHMYDGFGIVSYFLTPTQDSMNPACLQSLPWKSPMKDVTFAQLFTLSFDTLTASLLLQLRLRNKDPLPTLVAGTKWPITGGSQSSAASTSNENMKDRLLLVTGHKRGGIQVWDASAFSICMLCTVNAPAKEGASPVSVVVVCEKSGLLAYGCQEGKVYLLILSTETQEVPRKIISGASQSVVEEIMSNPAGYQFIAELLVHQAAITCICISSDSGRLAVGDASGMITILELENLLLIYFDCPGNSSSISGLKFVTQAARDKITVDPPDPRLGQPKSFASSSVLLYAVHEDATVIVLDGITGDCLDRGPIRTGASSKTLCMDVLGISTTTPPVEGIVGQDPNAQLSVAYQTISYLFLFTEDWIQVVYTPSQTIGDLRKVTLKHPCCWASTFKVHSASALGAILLYQSGHLEIRSLPDLQVLMETTLVQCLHWQLDLSPNFLATIRCTDNGHITMIHEEKELIHLSVLAEGNDLSVSDALPSLFDKDLAAAAVAALRYTTSLPQKKSLTKQGLLGVIRSALEKESYVHPASELSKLFSSQPFTVPPVQLCDLSFQTNPLDADVDIDDVLTNLDEMAVSSSLSDSGESSSKKKNLRSFTIPKGKEVIREEFPRLQLFGLDDGKPKQRSAEEIKAAYGHASKAPNTTNAFEMTRERLGERGEKLQALKDRTAEMQEGAENFASMAEQLAKKYEKRK